MMLLLFSINGERYGIDASQVIEVLPLLNIKPVHQTPEYVAGVVSYRGRLIPVLDISLLYTDQAAPERLSTRIILVQQETSNNKEHILGILAEQVTDTLKLNDTVISSLCVKKNGGLMQGEELLINEQIIQRVNIQNILPDDLYGNVFCDEFSADSDGAADKCP